jgi:cell division transport system permease protein
MLDRIEFLIGESFSALRRNTWMTFAAVTTVCMAIFILGGLGLAFFSFRNVVVGLGQRAEMKVLLLDTLPDRDASLLQGQILAIPGVKSATFVPRSEGLKQLLKENPDIDVEGLQIDNPLPNAYVVRVTELKDFDTVADQVGKIKGVEPRGVKYPADEKNFLMDTVKVLQWLGMALGAIMLATSGILIYNSIRMSVVARRRDIRIMHWQPSSCGEPTTSFKRQLSRGCQR